MTSSLEAEATGQPTIVARYLGSEFKLPADVDVWPLPLVSDSLVFKNGETCAHVNYQGLIAALRALLGDQWVGFKQDFPQRKHLIAASHAFAAAAGFPQPDKKINPQPLDEVFESLTQCFGGLPRLLVLLHNWPDKAESDLDRFWRKDYRDRWRFQDGQRCLTLRQINARLSTLPAESALAVVMRKRSPTDLILMDVYEGVTGRHHPDRPLTPEQLAERRKQVDKAQAEKSAKEDYRRRHGRRQPGGLVDTARANAQKSRKA